MAFIENVSRLKVTVRMYKKLIIPSILIPSKLGPIASILKAFYDIIVNAYCKCMATRIALCICSTCKYTHT